MALVTLLFFAIGAYELVCLAKGGKKKQIIVYSVFMAAGIVLGIIVAMGVDIYSWQEWINDKLSGIIPE